MVTRKNYKVRDALLKKGFEASETHHKYLNFYYEGRKTSISTYISHQKKEMGKNLRSKMARQLHITAAEFDELVDCSLSHQNLIDKYLEEGIVKR